MADCVDRGTQFWVSLFFVACPEKGLYPKSMAGKQQCERLFNKSY